MGPRSTPRPAAAHTPSRPTSRWCSAWTMLKVCREEANRWVTRTWSTRQAGNMGPGPPNKLPEWATRSWDAGEFPIAAPTSARNGAGFETKLGPLATSAAGSRRSASFVRATRQTSGPLCRPLWASGCGRKLRRSGGQRRRRCPGAAAKLTAGVDHAPAQSLQHPSEAKPGTDATRRAESSDAPKYAPNPARSSQH